MTEGAPSAGGSETAPPLRELVLYLARALVEHPDEVAVEEIDEPDATVFELKVAEGGGVCCAPRVTTYFPMVCPLEPWGDRMEIPARSVFALFTQRAGGRT